MTTKEKLTGYIRAGYPAVWMQTHEEGRSEKIIKDVAKAIGEIPGQEEMPVLGEVGDPIEHIHTGRFTRA